jgi:hypothetical protein
MKEPITPVGQAPAAINTDSPFAAGSVAYHRTSRASGQRLLSGGRPSLGKDGRFWLSTDSRGARHKSGKWVVKFVIIADEANKHVESRPPSYNSLLREGEAWLAVKDISTIEIDTDWGIQPAGPD